MTEINFTLNESSTKEEVVDFVTSLGSKEEVKNIIINEYITGDILPLLNVDELKSLGIKLGPAKKIMKHIDNNRSQFKEKEIDVKIYPSSTKNEIMEFFEKYLEFKGDLNSMDGKGLLEIKDEEEMKKLGLKYGQRKRLIKYLAYFKTLKPPVEENEEISISRKSSEQEVSMFLKLRLKFSQDSINNMELDGETFFDLKDEEIDKLNDITPEEKITLKNYLKQCSSEIKEEKKEEEIKLTKKSNTDDLCKFLEKNLHLPRESIKIFEEQEFDGELFLEQTEKEVKNFEGISDSDKEKIILFLNENKNKENGEEFKIDNKSSKEDVVKFLKNKLNFSEKTLKKWELDGQSLFSLNETDIEKIKDISPEEKEKLNKFLVEQKTISKNEENKLLSSKEIEAGNNKKDNEKKEPIDNSVKNDNNKNKIGEEQNKQGNIDEKNEKIIKEEEKKKEEEIKINKESKKEVINKPPEKDKLKEENVIKAEVDKNKDIKKKDSELLQRFHTQKLSNPKINIDNNIDNNNNENNNINFKNKL